MRILVQRSKNSKVSVEGKVIGEIPYGLVIFVCFTDGDTEKEIDYLVKKLINLRIFDDENHIMNRSIIDVKGSILSISQFTLYADTKKGNRPSYNKAMKGEEAILLYQRFNAEIKKQGIEVKTGEFGADMIVDITNDGPVTIWLEKEPMNA